MTRIKRLLTGAAALLLAGCQAALPPLATVSSVDLKRFMGDWYVIASIPTFIEKGAYNAIESYQLNSDGSIATTFTFRVGGFDGEAKRYTPRGRVLDGQSNALWGMTFIWPIETEYRIALLSEDYSQTVIARTQRDYVWIMARTPAIPEADYQSLLRFVGELGYDVSEVIKVPQQWP